MNTPIKHLIAIIGDVHSQIGLAASGLDAIEAEVGTISQVFSVGDLGLFLDEADWGFLSGPKRLRHQERTADIRKERKEWRWPLAFIGGKNEPWNRLRRFDPAWFGEHLTFTAAGEMTHRIPGLRVVGLSGIFNSEQMEFPLKHGKPLTWPEMVGEIGKGAGSVSNPELTYFRDSEMDVLLSGDFQKPHILLTHDWPICGGEDPHAYRPELTISRFLKPQFHFSGRHHRTHSSEHAGTRFRALNAIASDEHPGINPGWVYLLELNEGVLVDRGFWPPIRVSRRSGVRNESTCLIA